MGNYSHSFAGQKGDGFLHPRHELGHRGIPCWFQSIQIPWCSPYQCICWVTLEDNATVARLRAISVLKI